MINTNQKGCLAEYSFAAECMKRGIEVSFPLLDASVYDCIIDYKGQLLKIQVKSTGKVPQKNRSTVHVTFHGHYPIDKVDYFAIYVDLYEGFFIFPNNGKQSAVRLSRDNINGKYYNNFTFENTFLPDL